MGLEEKPVAEKSKKTQKSKPKNASRKTKHASATKHAPKRVKPKMGRRYTAAEKKNILTTAKRDGLTGAQVAKRFGVSTLTFYRWRGPVRGPKATAKRSSGRPRGEGNGAYAKSASMTVDRLNIREQIRSVVREWLPNIIYEEMKNALEK